jgi:hypothetical protein
VRDASLLARTAVAPDQSPASAPLAAPLLPRSPRPPDAPEALRAKALEDVARPRWRCGQVRARARGFGGARPELDRVRVGARGEVAVASDHVGHLAARRALANVLCPVGALCTAPPPARDDGPAKHDDEDREAERGGHRRLHHNDRVVVRNGAAASEGPCARLRLLQPPAEACGWDTRELRWHLHG